MCWLKSKTELSLRYVHELDIPDVTFPTTTWVVTVVGLVQRCIDVLDK